LGSSQQKQGWVLAFAAESVMIPPSRKPKRSQMSYCQALTKMEGDRLQLHKNYHDQFYGFPIHDDNELFGRLIMEINQAGLSWETILKKEKSFRKAYHGFNLKKVAKYTEKDRERLMEDPGIIRNRLKINAAIENAKTILQLQNDFGSFEKWLESHHPKSKPEWVQLFKKTFKFTGGEIVGEFLMSIGYLPGAHSEKCPVYKKALKAKPKWRSA
jgi:DNA-3-methyladenine glycosylase I